MYHRKGGGYENYSLHMFILKNHFHIDNKLPCFMIISYMNSNEIIKQ